MSQSDLEDERDLITSTLMAGAKEIADLRAKVKELTQERDALKQRIRDYSDITSGCPDVLVSRKLLATMIPAAEVEDKDAKRYRKLRKLHWSDGELCVTHACAVKLGYDCPSGDRLDAMLDAMEEKE